MEKPLISIIVPIYNADKYISRCIKCLTMQTYQNIEIILVNDGSIDDSGRICHEASDRDNRILVMEQENQGASVARNVGVRSAKGEYICFVDADDFVYPTYVEYLYYLIQKYDADVSICLAYKLGENEKVPTNFSKFERRNNEIEQFDSIRALNNLLYRRGISSYPCLKLYKRSIFNKISFRENIAFGEDTIFVFEVLQNVEKVVLGRKVLYLYYQNSSSINHIYPDVLKYKLSWDGYINYIYNVVMERHPELLNAICSKTVIYALDFYIRFYRLSEGKEFTSALSKYIKKCALVAIKDSNSKFSNRVLAFLCNISVPITARLCYVIMMIRRAIGVEARKAL